MFVDIHNGAVYPDTTLIDFAWRRRKIFDYGCCISMQSCRDIVHLLLLHGANPDVNWSGHSPLTLAIASGNDAVMIRYILCFRRFVAAYFVLSFLKILVIFFTLFVSFFVNIGF